MPADTIPGGAVADNPLDHYVAGAFDDLYRGASPPVAEKWRQAAQELAAMAGEGATPLQENVARQISDLGLTFRVAGDEEERAWPLTVMPLIIGADEWAGLERGLIQRVELLDRVAADIYGPQALVRDGHLPAAVVAGSRYFARKMVGLAPLGDHFIHVYAVDLARGPHGAWRVLADRVRLPTGIGYALENRLAMSRSTDALMSRIQTRRLADFYADLREGIARDSPRERPRIALLTPGRFNQSYPEQSHLARYLGVPLVEGRDLTVSDNKLYVRTIAGPKRIDAIWRWIDTNALDPLSFDARSHLGVANLFDAWSCGALEVANWPGAEVVEARALSAFLPRLCQVLQGEALILPNIATWWCGQAREARAVLDRLDELTIAPAFDQPVDGLRGIEPRPGADLSKAERAALLGAMQRRPMDYCGQEIVRLSTTPTLIGDQLTARAFTLRAFVARRPDGGWSVMPGGFARLSSSGELMTSLMGEGDLSADVCVVDTVVAPHVSALGAAPAIRRGGGILASQAADNLFWFGRYCERAETVTRVVRGALGSSIDADGGNARDAEVGQRLTQLLYYWRAIAADTVSQPMTAICGEALADARRQGSVAALQRQCRDVGMALRDRFASDFWRIVQKPAPFVDRTRPQSILSATMSLIEQFGALSGMVSENMVRSPAWRFLEIGHRLERALAGVRMIRMLAAGDASPDALNALLDLCDSQIVYRSRYLSDPQRDATLDLLLLDPENPRSLAFQLARIDAHLRALPSLREDNVPEAQMLEARALLGMVEGVAIHQVDEALLGDVEDRLLALSDTISSRYFLQFEKRDDGAPETLLA